MVGGVWLSCSSPNRRFSDQGSGGSAGIGGTAGNAAPGTGGKGGDVSKAGEGGSASPADNAGAAGAAGGGDEPTAGSAGAGDGSPCNADEYDNGTSCQKLTKCGADQYEKSPPTPTSDRTCGPISTCVAGMFVAAQPTATADRTCKPCTTSTFSSAQNVDACKPWTDCKATETESVPPSSTSDRVCSECGAGKYKANNQCQPLTVCSSSQYESVAATATSDRKCQPLTVCSSSQYESVAATTVSDRKCQSLTVCGSSQYESVAATATSDRKCQALTSCQPGNKETTAPTATTDRKCGACDAGTYSTAVNATSCAAWATCTWATGGVAQAGTPSSNAVCGTPSQYRQFGTSAYDTALGVATDGSGNVYVAGSTNGSLTKAANLNGDAFIRKYDPNGTVLWTRQFGNTSTTRATSVAPDSSGNVYVAGYTGALLEGTYYGSDDAFVRKYDSNGNVLWTRQLGTDWTDQASSVAVDGSGYAYVVGFVGNSLVAGTGGPGDQDAFMRKFDTDGNTLWTKQWGTTSTDNAYAVKAIGSGTGTVYVTGYVGGGELRTFALNGTAGWIKAFSASVSATPYGLAVLGSGEAFVTGYTSGNLQGTNAGSMDIFVRKYDASGGIAWTAQFGTPDWDEGDAIAVDGNGNSYVTGYTLSAIAGTNAGGTDAFLRKFSPSGSPILTQQFGTTSNDRANAMAVDGSGNLYIAGGTDGVFVGTPPGNGDAYVRQILP
ncbi:MAG TPA: SBBP repeat-containing protein [Polyangiaceae bacterium]|nr:SBBP repeat-containing protein [Polyangiaceae bacterium]